jgi:hypothetical protein
MEGGTVEIGYKMGVRKNQRVERADHRNAVSRQNTFAAANKKLAPRINGAKTAAATGNRMRVGCSVAPKDIRTINTAMKKATNSTVPITKALSGKIAFGA